MKKRAIIAEGSAQVNGARHKPKRPITQDVALGYEGFAPSVRG
jgi:hypothetical protein